MTMSITLQGPATYQLRRVPRKQYVFTFIFYSILYAHMLIPW
jgi:hypothetical protein